jgi:hypothetical protein
MQSERVGWDAMCHVASCLQCEPAPPELRVQSRRTDRGGVEGAERGERLASKGMRAGEGEERGGSGRWRGRRETRGGLAHAAALEGRQLEGCVSGSCQQGVALAPALACSSAAACSHTPPAPHARRRRPRATTRPPFLPSHITHHTRRFLSIFASDRFMSCFCIFSLLQLGLPCSRPVPVRLWPRPRGHWHWPLRRCMSSPRSADRSTVDALGSCSCGARLGD